MSIITQLSEIAIPQIMFITILLAAFYFALFTRPRVVLQMKRESSPLTLCEALDRSLTLGYASVNWEDWS